MLWIFYGLRWVGITLLIAYALSGCTTASQATFETIRLVWDGDYDTAKVTPQNPTYRYLKVTTGGRTAYLVLGYLETSGPHEPVEVWYSAKGEVIKTQSGRVVGTVGLEADWRAVILHGLPNWGEVAVGQGPWFYQRTKDFMPGYRMNETEALRLVPAAASQAVTALSASAQPLAKHRNLRWFQELTSETSANSPAAWYALNDQAQVVLTHQCLSTHLCLTLEPWAPSLTSAVPGASKTVATP